MCLIVSDLRACQQREFGLNPERKTLMRGPQGSVNRVALVRPREDEAEVAGTLGQRNQPLIRFGGYADIRHPRHRPGALDAGNPTVDPPPWNRNHHDAGGARYAPPAVRRLPQGVA